jgi:hypothetical protein
VIEVPTFVVISGGAVGTGHARQLLRAQRAGRLRTSRIMVVDRNRDCAAATLGAPVQVEVAEWAEWLDANLDSFGPDDHLVPYHWSPHLLQSWLTGTLRRRAAAVERIDAGPPRGLPLERDTKDGARALSYAAWRCPATCIEPPLCPHTRGPKDWSLAEDLCRPHPAFDHQVVFRCLHLLYGVGTVPIRDLHQARDRMVAGLAHGPSTYLVATASHCHGLATGLRVTPPRVR